MEREWVGGNTSCSHELDDDYTCPHCGAKACLPPRVEDSHAKLAAEMRAEAERAFSWTRGDGGRQIDVHPNYVEELASVIEEQAARVEALGSIGLVREGPRDVAQASARSGENVQSAQGRVEEKKAAAARRAIQALEQRCGEGWTGPNWEQEEQADRDAIEVLRALVESEKVCESASKKEDAGT